MLTVAKSNLGFLQRSRTLMSQPVASSTCLDGLRGSATTHCFDLESSRIQVGMESTAIKGIWKTRFSVLESGHRAKSAVSSSPIKR